MQKKQETKQPTEIPDVDELIFEEDPGCSER
jgi:hypothetical protein